MQEDQQQYYHPIEPPDPNQFGEWGEYEYREGFGVRFGAFLIDVFIYFVIFIILAIPAGIIEFYSSINLSNFADPNFIKSPEFKNINTITTAISSGLLLIYMIMDGFLAATPGKLILNRRIARDDRVKADVNLLSKRALIKWGFVFFSLLSLIPYLEFFGILGSLYNIIILIGGFAMLSQKKQALHDIFAKTAVYHVDDLKENK